MASGPHTFVTMVVFSATKFEGSRHIVISTHGPPNHPPLNPIRKARHANEFGLPSTVYLYDLPFPTAIPPPLAPTSSSATASAQQQPPPLPPAQSLRRLETFRRFAPGKGMQGFSIGEVAFEAGAVLAAAHYLCTYVERGMGGSLSHSETREQRLSFYLPRLAEIQRVLRWGGGADAAAAGVHDGRVNVMFNTYRQVAAAAIPSVASLFRIHKTRVPLSVVMEWQPQVKIVPGFEFIKGGSESHQPRIEDDEDEDDDDEENEGCPLISLGPSMHFILIDLTPAPTILPALTASSSPSSTTPLEDYVVLDDLPGWGPQALKSSIVGTIFFVRTNKDVVSGEATIENLRCRVFTFTSRSGGAMVEEEGLGNAAAVLAGYLSLLPPEKTNTGEAATDGGGKEDAATSKGGAVGGGGVLEGVQNLRVSPAANTTTSSSSENKDVSEPFGAEITPTPTHTQAPPQPQAQAKAQLPSSTSKPSPLTTKSQKQTKSQTQRKVYGISTAAEIGRDSMIAVEVDVIVDQHQEESKGERRLGGVVVSGRANFMGRGEILGS